MDTTLKVVVTDVDGTVLFNEDVELDCFAPLGPIAAKDWISAARQAVIEVGDRVGKGLI